MKNDRILLTCIAVVLATITAASTPARAAPEVRRMVVLIDASGSMSATRKNPDSRGKTRFEAAISLATDHVNEYTDATNPDLDYKVAVYIFHDSVTLIPVKKIHGLDGFIDSGLALDEIEALTLADLGDSTPLAGAMCEAGKILRSVTADKRILAVSSDGEENSTPKGNDCQGPTGTLIPNSDPPLFDPTDSWQNKVTNNLSTGTFIVQVDLFNSKPILFAPPAPSAPDPEGSLTSQARSSATTALASSGLTPLEELEEFFKGLTQATGGRLNVILDNEPLPLFGDLNGDRCVDHSDAILVAKAFGPIVPPVDGKFDLNLDRTVDFADYLIQLSRVMPTCGPDPYVPRAPVVCKGAKRIVIDGQSIENGGVTIDARGSCEITIKNSLIVSGQNAITIVGSALVTVDKSIIVGQNAVIMQHGAGVLSAANTIFHGKTQIQGPFQYIDRGGNVFE